MISRLQLKSFYESNKDEYYSRRNSGDSAQWDEGYKWDIFPKLNEVLAEYTTLTAVDIVNSLPKLTFETNQEMSND